MTINIVVIAALSLWFTLSVVRQFAKARIRDAVNLIPVWTFFAPIPGQTDYHLAYRDLSFDEIAVTQWTELLPHEHRSALAGIWNPNKRLRKAVIDYCQALLMSDLGLDDLRFSLPYLALLNVTMAEPVAGGAELRQFMIVSTRRFGTTAPAVLFQSELHSL